MQFCWAHLIRAVKFLTTLTDRATRRFGEKLLASIKHFFRTWHKREEMPADRWRRAADRTKGDVLTVIRRPPLWGEAKNIARRFRFVFLYQSTVAYITNQAPPSLLRTLPVQIDGGNRFRGPAPRAVDR